MILFYHNLVQPVRSIILWGFILTGLLVSCGTIEVLDGLCYNDKEGTYLCPAPVEEEEPGINIQDDGWDTCKKWIEVDSEVWMNCIMLEQSRRERMRNTA